MKTDYRLELIYILINGTWLKFYLVSFKWDTDFQLAGYETNSRMLGHYSTGYTWTQSDGSAGGMM